MAERELLTLHLVPAAYSQAVTAHAALVQAHAAATKGKKADKAPPAAPELRLRGYSGRGVRLRTLTFDEKEKLMAHAAAQVGESGTMPELISRRNLEGAKAMVAMVTRKGGHRTLEGLAPEEWIELTDADKDGPTKGALAFEALFTPKDVGALKEMFTRTHDASALDVDAIEGKAYTVLV